MLLIFRDDIRRDFAHQTYQRQIDWFIDICKKFGVREEQIATFGSIKHPGISDIDMVVSAKPELLRSLCLEHQKKYSSDGDYAYCFWHAPTFVLEDRLEQLFYLHTVDNLTPLKSSSYFIKNISSDTDEFDVLNIVWFLSLLPAFCRILAFEKIPQSVSLRFFLLVFKNLEYSVNQFTRILSEGKEFYNKSPILRDRVLLSNRIDHNEMFSEFKRLVLLSLDLFDRCSPTVFKSDENFSFVRKSTILSGRQLIFANPVTVLYPNKYFNILGLNRHAFYFFYNYVNNNCLDSLHGSFIERSLKSQNDYSRAGIDYPFVCLSGYSSKFINCTIAKIIVRVFSWLY